MTKKLKVKLGHGGTLDPFATGAGGSDRGSSGPTQRTGESCSSGNEVEYVI